MLKASLLVLLFVAGTQAFWRACPSGPAPTNVVSAQCTDRCVVNRGGTLRATVTFTPPAASTVLNVQIFAQAAGFPETELPVTPPHNNACNFLWRGGAQVSCPTIAGTPHVWEFDAEVPTELPAFAEAQFRFVLNGGATLCFIADGTLL